MSLSSLTVSSLPNGSSNNYLSQEFSDKYPSSLNINSRREVNDVVTIAQKPFDSRTFKETAIFSESLKKFDFIKDMLKDKDQSRQRKILAALTKRLKYEHFKENNAVFQEADMGKKVYFIMHGNAVEFVPAANNSIKGLSRSDLEAAKKSRKSINPSSINLDEERNLLFQPKLGKGIIRRFTTLGVESISDETKLSSNVLSTLTEVEGKPKLDNILDDSLQEDIEEEDEEEEAKRQEEIRKRDLGYYRLLTDLDTNFPDKYSKDGRCLFKPTKIFRNWDCFGSANLICKKPRTSTVVASNDLHVLTLKRERYNSILEEKTDDLDVNVKFFKDVLFKSGDVYTNFIKLASLFEECHYSINNTIFTEKDNVSNLYFIREGEVHLSVVLSEIKTVSRADESQFIKVKKKHLLTTVGQGEALGEEEFFFNIKNIYTATVASNRAILLRLKKSVYENLSSNYKSLFRFIIETSRAKQEIRIKKVNDIIQTTQVTNKDNEHRAKMHQIQRKQVRQQRVPVKETYLGDTLSAMHSFQRGYIATEASVRASIERLSHQMDRPSSTQIVTCESFNRDSLSPPKEKADIISIKNRRRLTKSKQKYDTLTKNIASNDIIVRKSYIDQLGDFVSSLNILNSPHVLSTLPDERPLTALDNSSPIATLNLISSRIQNNSRMFTSSPPKNQIRESMNDLESSPLRRIIVTSPGRRRPSPQPYNSHDIHERVNTSTHVAARYFGPTEKEKLAIQNFKSDKPIHASLIEKIKNSSPIFHRNRKNVLNSSMADTSKMMPTSHSRLHDLLNCAASKKCVNIHVEKASLEKSRSLLKSQENINSQSDLKRVVTSSKHNMFRLKSDRKFLQEKYLLSKSIGGKVKVP